MKDRDAKTNSHFDIFKLKCIVFSVNRAIPVINRRKYGYVMIAHWAVSMFMDEMRATIVQPYQWDFLDTVAPYNKFLCVCLLALALFLLNYITQISFSTDRHIHPWNIIMTWCSMFRWNESGFCVCSTLIATILSVFLFRFSFWAVLWQIFSLIFTI